MSAERVLLGPLDDYPVHQVAEPMRQVGTTDRNFYDRYYFNGFDHDGRVMFVMGLGVYPNLGVMDAFMVTLVDGQHRVVRASRALDGADRMAPSVGPLSIDVVEPLERLRVVCEPNDWGLELDATWTGALPVHPEPRHRLREHGRLVFDTFRMAQTGGWDGRLVTPEGEFSLNGATWWGTRDRSWGIRPVGEAEPPGIRALDAPTWFWVYVPIRFADHTIICIMQEEADGRRILDEAVRVWHPGSNPPDGVDVGEVELLGVAGHDLAYEPGTRRSVGGTISTSGYPGSPTPPLAITVEPLVPLYVGIGTGYGFDANWRHGMWQGPLEVQGEHIDTTTPDGQARLMGIVDASARFTYTDGHGEHVGFGLFEHMVVGPYPRYGFADLLDGHPG